MSRVLLIDDDADALQMRRLIFERRGHRVTVAVNAAQAREQFLADPPEAVILDLRVPDPEDGLALIREFRAASRGLHIVVLSGWRGDIEGRTEASLVNRILSKPIRSEVLLAAIL